MAKRTRAARGAAPAATKPSVSEPSTKPSAPAPSTKPSAPARVRGLPLATRPRFWLDFERSWASWICFRFVFFGLHAVDAVLQLSHAPRYGAGDFNVTQVPLPLPDPSRVGMSFVYGAMAIAFAMLALGVGVRVLLPLAAALYSYAYFISQLDSYQHHYLMCLLLIVLCFVPTAPTRVGADGRRWVQSWALRLALVQLAIVYLWAAIAKLEGPWLDGTLLTRQLRPDSSLRTVVSALGFATVAKLVLVTEATLAATVWNRRAWFVALPLGLGLHLGVEWMDLDIGLFSYYMLGSYLLVMPALVPEGVVIAVTRLGRPLAAIPTTVWLGLAAIALGLGVVLVARHPLPLGAATVAGVAMIAGAAIARRARGLRGVAGALGAGAAGFAIILGVLATTDTAPDHFRMWAGASRRMHLPTERAAYEGLLAVDPRSEYAHYYLGQLDLAAGAVDAARAHFAAGQRGAPTRARCYLAEVDLLIGRGELADARAVVERGLTHAPADAELLARRARLGAIDAR